MVKERHAAVGSAARDGVDAERTLPQQSHRGTQQWAALLETASERSGLYHNRATEGHSSGQRC